MQFQIGFSYFKFWFKFSIEINQYGLFSHRGQVITWNNNDQVHHEFLRVNASVRQGNNILREILRRDQRLTCIYFLMGPHREWIPHHWCCHSLEIETHPQDVGS